MSKIQKVISFAMRMELDASYFYSYYKDKVESESIRKLFGELVEIEKGHYEILKKKYDLLQFSEPPLPISWVVDDSAAARDPHILADTSDIIGNVPEGASDLMIIRMAYLIENDFAEFYRNAMDIAEDSESRKFLGTMASWEEIHREMFHKRYKEMLKKHWDDISSILFSD